MPHRGYVNTSGIKKLFDEYIENTPIEVAVYSLKTVLTDAQIKTLHNTYAELLPAPGADKLYLLHSAVFVMHSPDEEFYNLQASNPAIDISYGAGTYQLIYHQSLSGLFNTAESATLVVRPVITTSGGVTSSSNLHNQPIHLLIESAGIIGGGAANTLEVTVFYSIVDL